MKSLVYKKRLTEISRWTKSCMFFFFIPPGYSSMPPFRWSKSKYAIYKYEVTPYGKTLLQILKKSLQVQRLLKFLAKKSLKLENETTHFWVRLLQRHVWGFLEEVFWWSPIRSIFRPTACDLSDFIVHCESFFRRLLGVFGWLFLKPLMGGGL